MIGNHVEIYIYKERERERRKRKYKSKPTQPEFLTESEKFHEVAKSLVGM